MRWLCLLAVTGCTGETAPEPWKAGPVVEARVYSAPGLESLESWFHRELRVPSPRGGDVFVGPGVGYSFANAACTDALTFSDEYGYVRTDALEQPGIGILEVGEAYSGPLFILTKAGNCIANGEGTGFRARVVDESVLPVRRTETRSYDGVTYTAKVADDDAYEVVAVDGGELFDDDRGERLANRFVRNGEVRSLVNIVDQELGFECTVRADPTGGLRCSPAMISSVGSPFVDAQCTTTATAISLLVGETERYGAAQSGIGLAFYRCDAPLDHIYELSGGVCVEHVGGRWFECRDITEHLAPLELH